MKIFAFWRYDFFPYALGGEVAQFCKRDFPGKDFIETVNSPGYYHKPIKILPVKEGIRIQKELEVLADDYRIAQDKLHLEYEEKAKKIADFIK